ncbi:MAG: SusD/RagB family nutrient-binding outer membrane lipoprotein [Acidimicrobiia bacterium]|nr:SusD/RagB family nutrient-binding outer membrane lipoprotein [Acidimicrobiia bacterium]
MKKIKIYILSLLSIVFFRCDDLAELNIDPNAAVNVDPSSLLTYGEYQLYNMMGGVSYNADWGLLMVQQWAQNEYTEDSRYNQDITFFNNDWIRSYVNIIKEFESAKELVDIQDVSENIKTNRKNILDVMIVQAFANLTDGFGDIPYSEVNNSDISLPAYDNQAEIYEDLLMRLDNASNTFDTSSISFTSGDIIFNGDVSKWKKFTNALILRYSLRVSDANESLAQMYISSAAGYLMSSNNDNALFTFDSNPDRSNPLYQNFAPVIGNRDDYCVSEYFVDTLKDLDDPRLEKFAKPAPSGEIVGMPYGLSDNAATELKASSSRPTDEVRSATTPHVILSYSEVQFLLSEAYQRGLLTGNASDAYNEAIEASMNYWGITDATAIMDYTANNAYDASNWKMHIGVQKWISLYMNGFQAWNEWRRLDYPVLEVPSEAVISSIPVRFPYPLSETQNNSTQLEKVTSDPSDMTTKVWWDIN